MEVSGNSEGQFRAITGTAEDQEMLELAVEERAEAIQKLMGLERELLGYLVPVDEDEERGAVLEVDELKG